MNTIIKTIVLSALVVLCSTACSINPKSSPSPVDTSFSLQLSDIGSARATAYSPSNKIIETDQFVFVTYLENVNGVETIRLAKIATDTHEVITIQTIGEANDDHGGATILMDDSNNFHLFYGSHSESLKYLYNTDGFNISQWSDPINITSAVNYPSAIMLPNQDILLLIRRITGSVNSNNIWEYELVTISHGSVTNSQTLMLGNTFGDDVHSRYINYIAHLCISSDERLHIAFMVHESPSDDPHILEDGIGYGISYIYSDNYGSSWYDLEGNQLSLPARPVDIPFIEGGKKASELTHNFRDISLTIDPRTNHPYITYTLFDFVNTNWKTWMVEVKSGPLEKKFISDYAVQTSVFMDDNGIIYIQSEEISDATILPIPSWGHESSRIKILRSTDGGNSFSEIQTLSSSAASGPDWLAQFPKYYSATMPTPKPYFLYSNGNNKPSGNGVFFGLF